MSKSILDIRNGNVTVLADVTWDTLQAVGAIGYDVSNPTSDGRKYGNKVKMLNAPTQPQAYMQELSNLIATLDRFGVELVGDFKLIDRSKLPQAS